MIGANYFTATVLEFKALDLVFTHVIDSPLVMGFTKDFFGSEGSVVLYHTKFFKGEILAVLMLET